MTSTLLQLRNATRTLRPDYTGKLPNQANPVKIIRQVPNLRSKFLLIEGEVFPVTGDHPYKVSIQFFGMDCVDVQSRARPMPLKLQDGKTVYCQQFSYQDTPVLVRCTCPDFRFVWSWWDNSIRSLLGPPKHYTRKTPPPPAGRPFANPVKTPGLCKHLIEFSLRLNQEGIVA